MKKGFTGFCSVLMLFAVLALTASAQNFKVTIDLDSARGIVKLFEQGKASDAEIEQLIKIFGTRKLIEKVKGYNAAATGEVFKLTLREVLRSGKTIGPDPYEWHIVKQNLSNIKKLIDQIERNQSDLLSELNGIIQAYSPADLTGEVRASLLTGGGSLGFVLKDDPTLFVALHKDEMDYEGLKWLLAHELYHSVQRLGKQKRIKNLVSEAPPVNIKNSYLLINNTWSEGTATFVGDFLKIKNPRGFSLRQQALFNKNLERSWLNFLLLETLLYRAYHDPEAKIDQFYNIGFTTSFDETAYFVGYEMAKTIESHRGKEAIASLIGKSPVEFFKLYIDIYKQANDKKIVRFSPPVEDIIHKMQEEWKDKL